MNLVSEGKSVLWADEAEIVLTLLVGRYMFHKQSVPGYWQNLADSMSIQSIPLVIFDLSTIISSRNARVGTLILATIYLQLIQN